MKITVIPPKPLPYDAIVSARWADEVAAGRGTEGAEFNSGSDSFRLFSSVQGAVDSGAQNIGVTSGEYMERRWWQFWR